MVFTIIAEDNLVAVDGVTKQFNYSIDPNIWAVQWDGVKGEVEYRDSTPNLDISEVGEFQSILDAFALEVAAAEQAEATRVVSLDEVRSIRQSKLQESDWRMLPDYNGADLEAWKTYRQALRDMPGTYTPTPNPVYPLSPAEDNS